MAEESFQEKTEPATGKKREEARKRGHVARSLELNSALILVFGMLILSLAGGNLVSQLADMTRGTIAAAGSFRVTAASIHAVVPGGILKVGLILAPVVLGVGVVGLAAGYAQVGFQLSGEALQPRLERFNPLKGIKKVLISRRSLVELLKNLVKVAIVGGAGAIAVQDVLEESMTLLDGDAGAALGFIGRASLSVGMKTGLAFLVLAVLDYLYQRFEYEHDLRMTRQEVKEEHKALEGDPVVRGRIRGVQRRIAYRRMMHDVPTADVVVTNPTHLAIALRYDLDRMQAPAVVAKGADLIAQRIREIAREHDIPIVEDRPLAWALYRTVEIGEQIPEKLFQAVAQLLATIYRLRPRGPEVHVT
jgi:flagellar biosynthetic protein FlhB